MGNRQEFMHYSLENFNEEMYAPNSSNAFVIIGNWSDSVYSDCDLTRFSGCKTAIYNTADNSVPVDVPPHSNDSAPAVIKIAAYVNLLDENGLPDEFMIQHLAAFLMALREINDKTDGIHDDLLPNTEIVFCLKQPNGLIGLEIAVAETLHSDFSDTGTININY
jgi:hypothetical protein